MIKILKTRHKKIQPINSANATLAVPERYRSIFRFLSIKSLFFWVVLFPTLVASVYFLFIASDIYISESNIIIRQSDSKKNLSGIGAFLQSAGISTSREDVYTLKEFLSSRDVLQVLDVNLHLRKEYSNRSIDFIRRFNPFGTNDSFESLYYYYQDHIVSVDVDSTSSIFTIKVKAFTPELAHAINSALLFIGEGFVNELNERARNDLVNLSGQEVESAEAATRTAAMALADFRNRQTLFDPTQQSTIQLQNIAKLQSDLVEVRGQLTQLRTFTAESPYIKSLEKRSTELQKEINSQMSKITGGSNSMVQKMSEYERLTIDRDFMEKRLQAALSSLEQARSESQRQRLYLAVIAKPNIPDSTRYPERGFNILIAFFSGLLIYGCLHILIIGTKEHQA